jgi:energy-coupling factor transporter ATP-binding protein EcfA2
MPTTNLFTNDLQDVLYRSASGFVPSRIILVNYWLYNDVAFHFAQGRLFFTGHNGSGKSTALTAAVTSLLDGNTRPERLDPFGGGRRSLRYYILGGSDAGFVHSNRRSYIALEFRAQDGSYQTIGLGLSASDGSSDIRKWGFSFAGRVQTEDGVQLVQDSGEPVSRRQLEELLSKVGGRVVEGEREYEELVRKTVFAGANETNFKDLIELLLTVRGAKLGREVKPSAIEQLLRRSLPQVSSEVVEQLSNGIEDIDRHAETVKRIDSQLEAAREIAKAHFDRAFSNAQLEFLRRQQSQVQATRALASRDATRLELTDVRQKLEGFQTQEQTLLLEQGGLQTEADLLTGQLENAEGALLRTETELENARRDVKRVGDAIRRGNERLERLAVESEQQLAAKLSSEQQLEQTFEVLSGLPWWNADQAEQSLYEREKNLNLVQSAVRDYERDTALLGQRESDEKQALEQTQTARANLEERTLEFENLMRDTAQTLTQEALQMFPLEKPQLLAYQEALESTLEPLEAAASLEPVVTGFLDEARAVHEERRDARKQLETRLNNVKTELHSLETQTEVAPKLPADRAKASRVLELADITHRAFFECVKPLANAQNIAQLEAGLLESGLLTALLVPAKDRALALELLGREQLNDALLIPQGQAIKHLGSLLEPESDAPTGTLEVLQSISLDLRLEAGGSKLASVSAGSWTNGLLLGSLSGAVSQVRFIGSLARAQERLRQIAVLQKNVAQLEQELAALGMLEQQALDDLRRLEAAWTRLRDAQTEAKLRRNANANRDRARNEFQTRGEQHERILIQLENARASAKQTILKLETSFELLGVALENALIDDFEASPRERLSKAQLEFQKANENHRQTEKLQTGIQQNLKRLEDIGIEQTERGKELQESNLERAQYETKRDVLSEQLEIMRREIENPDRADMRSRLNKAKTRLASLRREHDELRSQLSDARASIRQLEERLPEQERNSNQRQAELERAEQKWLEARQTHPKLATLEFASNLGLESLENKRREHEITLNGVFYDKRDRLETPESFQPVLTNTYDVRFTLEGASVQPDELLEFFENSLEAARRLLSDEEARVFHDELINTIAEELDKRIQQARAWVKDVRATLRTLAFHNEQLDLELEARQTDGLARLLDGKIDPETQPESWRSSLRDELRQIVRNLRETTDGEISFPQALAKAFDYREWYGFKFFSIVGADDGSRRREITDRSFQSRSGGERSAVLYTFLFAAIGARFDALGASVPRLIGLDEAFAGMDAPNISALYKVMTALELSWIATSERRIDLSTALPAAATYQLFRATSANGDDGVSSLAFLWNGVSQMDARGLLA